LLRERPFYSERGFAPQACLWMTADKCSRRRCRHGCAGPLFRR
jgi:hypothetical protein